MSDVFKRSTHSFAVAFFTLLKPKTYSSETLKEYEKLKLAVEKEQRLLASLVQREISVCARSLKAQEKYSAK